MVIKKQIIFLISMLSFISYNTMPMKRSHPKTIEAIYRQKKLCKIRNESNIITQKFQVLQECQECQEIEDEYKGYIHELTKKSQRPNEVCVPMWGSGSISSQPISNQPLILSTSGLAGCIATALHVKYNNGEQYAGMTHYPPSSINVQKNAVRNLWLEAFASQHQTKKIEAVNSFVIVPGEEQKNNDHWELVIASQENRICTSLHTVPSEISLSKEQIVETYSWPYYMIDMICRDESLLKPRDLEVVLGHNGTSITLNKQPYKQKRLSYSINRQLNNNSKTFSPYKAIEGYPPRLLIEWKK